MANTYLQRSTTTRTNNQAYTFSCWFKRSALVNGRLCQNYLDGNNRGYISINGDSNLYCYDKVGGVVIDDRQSLFHLRDINGWYHYVQSVNNLANGSGGSVNDRFKTYLNGVDVSDQWTKNTGMAYNVNIGMQSVSGTNGYKLGSQESGSDNFNGLMSHVHFVDGLQLPASTFGETDATTGEWKIKTSPTVSEYGNNGFFILKDGNSLTDQSGKGNNLTVGGGTLTKTEDSPSNVFATWNPLIGRHTNGTNLVPTLSNGNTTSFSDGSTWQVGLSTLAASSGKYYTEVKWISDSNTRYSEIGLYEVDAFAQKITGYPYMPDMANCYGLRDSDGNIRTGGSATSYGVSYGPSNIISVAMDLDNNKLYYAKDGVWMNSANPSSGTGGFSITANKTYAFGLQQYAVGNITFSTNFGNGYFGTTAVSSAGTNASGIGIFEYDVPTGFTALSTKGLNL